MQIPGESIGIIADDLTGACDTGLQFHLEGGNTRILLDYTAATQATSTQIWLANTDSRHLGQYDAVAAVKKSVHFLRQQVRLDRFYKKMDSTLRGHIAQECLAILDELRWKAAIIAPAYPDEGRRTVGGYQLVRGLPVSKTDIAFDPLFPVRDSHLPTLLGKTSDPSIVGHITLAKVLDGAGPILMAIQDLISQNKKLIVVDACTDTDLEQLSLAINKMPSDVNVLPCGSAGLAKALSRKWVLHNDRQTPLTPVIEKTPIMVVIGSASKATRNQLEALIQNYSDYVPDGQIRLFSFSPAQILGVEPVDTEIQEIIQALEQHWTVIISTSYPEDNLQKTLLLAEEYNQVSTQASMHASDLLARITRDVLSRVPAKLLLSGGETANSVCKALGTRTLQIIDQIETSIPLMIDDQARWIVTKSGGFGNAMSLLNIVHRLKEMESEEEDEGIGRES